MPNGLHISYLLEQFSGSEEKLKETIHRLQEELKQHKAEIKQLRGEKKIQSSKKHINSIVSNELWKYFPKSQTKSILTQKRVRWAEEDIVQGLMLCSLSKKTYLYICKKKLFPVPALSTLQKWVSQVDISPGILTDVLKMLKKQIDSYSNPKLKLGVFCFDEMDFKKKYEYLQKKDQIFGPSKKIQVGMVRGLCGNWKQPVFFDFDCPMTENLLRDILLKIESTGIEVWAVVCDSSSTNQAVLKRIGINTEKTSFQNPADPSRPVFVFPDVPHLLKLIRNHILDEGIFVDGSGSKLSRSDLESLLQIDNGEFKILHKLKNIHLQCTGPQRQRVRLAAQVLSHSVATALKLLCPEKAIQAEFIELANNWFDVLNSRTKFDKNRLSCGFGVHFEEQKQVLESMIEASLALKCDSRVKTAPFQRGIIISSKSLLGLFEELREKREVEFILTSHLNQDCLENFFSRIRAMGGTYNHPTTVECINRIKNLIIGRASDLVIPSAAVAMEKDDCEIIEKKSGFLTQKITKTIEIQPEP